MTEPWQHLTDNQRHRKADALTAALTEIGIKAQPDYNTGGAFTSAWLAVDRAALYRASCLSHQAIGEVPWDEWNALADEGWSWKSER